MRHEYQVFDKPYCFSLFCWFYFRVLYVENNLIRLPGSRWRSHHRAARDSAIGCQRRRLDPRVHQREGPQHMGEFRFASSYCLRL